jgi:Cellulose binding domain
MAVSKRAILAASAIAAGAFLLVALMMTAGIAGNAAAADTPAGGCSATARVDSQWGTGTSGGQIVTVTVVNTSATAGTRWTVTWRLAAGQRVASSWSATVSTSGDTVTAVNLPYNGALAPGASTAFGMQLAGTGPAPAPSCSNDAAPASSGTPPTGADVTVTEADSGTTVTLLYGQTLGVSLPSAYRPPTVNGPALRQVSTSGGYPTGQPVSAVYRAVAAGEADVNTVTDMDCFHTTPPCAAPVKLWTVHVLVLNEPPGGGQTVTVTTADNTSAVNLHVGDTLVVSLPSMYQPPTVNPSGVLAAGDVAGGYPTGQPLVARYRAVAAGRADVSTITDADCIHQRPLPCPSPQVPWTVHVEVAG